VTNGGLKRKDDRAIKKADTKAKTIKEMRNFMDNKTGSVKIHKEKGVIQEEGTYQRKDGLKTSRG
jgi:hypothetical protein